MNDSAGKVWMSPEEFRAWRTKEGLTWKEAAAKLGINWRTVARYEEGALPVPKPIWLATLALSAKLAF